MIYACILNLENNEWHLAMLCLTQVSTFCMRRMDSTLPTIQSSENENVSGLVPENGPFYWSFFVVLGWTDL